MGKFNPSWKKNVANHSVLKTYVVVFILWNLVYLLFYNSTNTALKCTLRGVNLQKAQNILFYNLQFIEIFIKYILYCKTLDQQMLKIHETFQNSRISWEFNS